MTNKIKKFDQLEDICVMLNGEKPIHGTTLGMALATLHKEMETITKRNENRKSAKDDEKNIALFEQVVNILTLSTQPMTITEVVRAMYPEDISTSKVTWLVNNMGEGTIVKSVSKGKTYYTVAR